MIAKLNCLCVLVLFFSLADCQAGWLRFWDGSNPDHLAKTLWRDLSAEEEVKFEQLANRRSEIRAEITMLLRLIEEKHAENDSINLELKLAFGVSPDAAYRFDQTGKALYRMPARSKETDSLTASDASEGGVLHRVLSEKESAEFLKLVGVRQQNRIVLQGLEILNKQKLGQWERVCGELLREFNVQRDQNYHYDKEKRSLYWVTTTNVQ